MTGPLIVFDSGVGGLSILREIIVSNLGYPLVYLADQANFPYGSKSPSWLTDRLANIAKWTQPLTPSAFVIACNTATVNSVSRVRSILDCPVIGVEPVIKPLGKYAHPLVLTTTATKSSPRHQELIAKYAPNTISTSPHGLVQAIEAMDEDAAISALKTLAPTVQSHSIDGIGLSCTHYPLVKNTFIRLFPQVTLIDPSAAVVKHLRSLLTPRSDQADSLKFLTTGDPQTLASQVKYYLDLDIKANKVEI